MSEQKTPAQLWKRRKSIIDKIADLTAELKQLEEKLRSELDGK